MSLLYRIAVRPTRRVRDIIRRKKFEAVKLSPGGSEIALGKAETRRRAVIAAQNAARPNGSPTSGGNFVLGYRPGSEGGGGRNKMKVAIQ